MKSGIKLILFLVMFNFLFTESIFAVSGDCSWHGGINCSAGADWDGSVICNDGWKDSKDSFFDAKECKETIRCSYQQYLDLQKKYNISDLLKEKQSYNEEITKYKTEILELEIEKEEKIIKRKESMPGALYSRILGEQEQIRNEYNSTIREKELELNLLFIKYEERVSEIDKVNYIIEGECKILGYENEKDRMLERARIVEEARKEAEKKYCPENSYYTGKECNCNIGYEWNNFKTTCVKIQEKIEIDERIEPLLIGSKKEVIIEEKPKLEIQEFIQGENKIEPEEEELKEIKNENQEEQKEQEIKENKGFFKSVSGFFSNTYNSVKRFFSKIF